MTINAYEVNFDGLVGPTHNYAGLAVGNVASQQHRHETSSPKAAALQGLAKMKLLADLGVRQAVLPPQPRPDVAALRRLGFDGSDQQVLRSASREAPQLFAACASASCMWAANAATVSPSADTADGRLHLTAANLSSHLHRSIEAETTAAILRCIFADESAFAHHRPLAATPVLSDEGAANHTRLCRHHHEPGLEIFVYGEGTAVYPARQSRRASQAIARLHRLDATRTYLVAQDPRAIDAGVFHNDVVAVGHQNVLLYHTQAFAEGAAVTERLRRAFEQRCRDELVLIEVATQQLSLDDAVKTYLFNSQLVALPGGAMALVCPVECEQHRGAKETLDHIVHSVNPIEQVHFVDTRQSMRNGGGPACLRLRVVLTEAELAAVHQGVLFTDERYARLIAWVKRHYRDTLTPDDLADSQLLEESCRALDELTQILALGSIFPFQGR